MEYGYLGRTGMRVSRFSLGTMHFGVRTPADEAYRIMDMARDAGINYFDTADRYGTSRLGPEYHAGRTEEIIGEWMAMGDGRRDSTIIGTKAAMSMPNRVDAFDEANDAEGVSAYKIRHHVEKSLKRLGTDHIDLHMMHQQDNRTSWDEIWDAYQALIFQGKVTYVGTSNFTAEHLRAGQASAEARHIFGIASEEPRYNLLSRAPEKELFPTALELGLGIITWSPLMHGILSGHLFTASGSEQLSAKMLQGLPPETGEKARAFEKLCDEAGLEPSLVATAWPLQNPAVSTVLLGPRTVEQLANSLKAAELKLDENLLAELDKIFEPGVSLAYE